MNLLNKALTPIVDVVQAPLRVLPDLVGVAVWGLVIGIFALFIVKWTSNQRAIKRVKDRLGAAVYEIRLLNDDLRAIFRGMFVVLGNAALYLGLFLVPLLVMAPAIVVWYFQVDGYYGYEGLEPGERTLVTAELTDEAVASALAGTKPAIELSAPDGVRVVTPALWIPAEGEVVWGVVADREGEYTLAIETDGERFEKTVVASGEAVRRSPSRTRPGFFNALQFPGEAALPSDGPLEAIRVRYPEEASFLEAHLWSWIFVLFTLVFGYILKDPLGVEV